MVNQIGGWLLLGLVLLCVFHLWGWVPLFWVALGAFIVNEAGCAITAAGEQK